MCNKFDHITNKATEPSKKWSNADKALFHYLNPHGLYSRKKALDDSIDEAVGSGKCKSGSIITYGCLNNYRTNKLARLALQKRVKSSELRETICGLEYDIECAKAFLETLD